ncbi:hypothetical protein HNY73_006574 [Argiope bruennichi]|uniref:Uncharacterized protein n=1 Tax=Argiope bruennichi TaxID=94029 RepID=A0A8T0FDS9_ARGBR|nr:hypothetical protein HNY73_006574 [Argiope bruennichi]
MDSINILQQQMNSPVREENISPHASGKETTSSPTYCVLLNTRKLTTFNMLIGSLKIMLMSPAEPRLNRLQGIGLTKKFKTRPLVEFQGLSSIEEWKS